MTDSENIGTIVSCSSECYWN